jgi:chromosome segregation ATPase
VAKIRRCHDELLEAEIRFIEAKSDVAALNERNAGIVQQLEEERQVVKEAELESKKVKETARRALEVCQAIRAEADAAGNLEYFQNISPDLTVRDLETDIASEESKLDYIHANNPNAIVDFERRQIAVDKLKEKTEETEEKLEKIGRRITEIRSEWEPELDKLIAEISDAFSYNFEQIGCAGEVGVHKDDDFDNWAVQIKVKFR